MTVKQEIAAVKKIYAQQRPVIEKALAGFRAKWAKGSPGDILHEMIFCIFTPQSKAVNCWACVERIIEDRLIMNATPAQLLKLKEMNGVRFKNKKAVYACLARDLFVRNGKITIKDFLGGFKSPYEMREWLVRNIKGYGYKESSHFLRNIGFGDDIAILDRHILKNLVRMGVIPQVPESLTHVRYLEIEQLMKKFAKKTGIPMDGLDLALWFREAGHVFK
jgi:N-glycosylase/DNA lyase